MHYLTCALSAGLAGGEVVRRIAVCISISCWSSMRLLVWQLCTAIHMRLFHKAHLLLVILISSCQNPFYAMKSAKMLSESSSENLQHDPAPTESQIAASCR